MRYFLVYLHINVEHDIPPHYVQAYFWIINQQIKLYIRMIEVDNTYKNSHIFVQESTGSRVDWVVLTHKAQ